MKNYTAQAEGLIRYGFTGFAGFLGSISIASGFGLNSTNLIAFGYLGSLAICISYYYVVRESSDKKRYLLAGWYLNAGALAYGLILMSLQKIKEKL